MKALLHDTKHNLRTQKFEANKLPYIEAIESEIYNSLMDSKGAIRDMCNHILGAGGKRIRPLLVLYSGLIFSEPTPELLLAAAAAELIHMASLVHDDIIDESPLRRNKPSINKVWGNHFAVLCGDYLFAKAFSILSSNRLIKSLDYMVEAIQSMCYGEIFQAGDRFREDVDIDTYYDRIAKKTAIFLDCCCKSGAAVCGASEKQIQTLGEYGLNLGLAFQIIDDILDFCGDAGMMGKPKGEDLRQGNITLPLVLLLKNDKYCIWIKDIIRKRDFSPQVINEIVNVLNSSGIIDESFNTMVSHIGKAKHCLGLLPESRHVNLLYDITEMLQARMN